MIRSMTGFASKTMTITVQESKIALSFALKSLNSRFFETSCKLPYPLSNLETEFIKLFKEQLLRGYVTFTIHLGSANAFKAKIEPSLPTISSYLQALEQIQKRFALEGSIALADVLQLPNVFNAQEEDLRPESKQLLFDTTQQLLKELITMQTKEGLVLKKDLQQRISLVEQEITVIETAFEELMKTQKKKVDQSLQELEMDESKFAEVHKSALYVMLDKIDIHEEIVRFKNHLKNFAHELDTATIEKGKRFDFILQELGREINTITAKCSDSIIGTHAINIKVELEKAREQTQNIV